MHYGSHVLLHRFAGMYTDKAARRLICCAMRQGTAARQRMVIRMHRRSSSPYSSLEKVWRATGTKLYGGTKSQQLKDTKTPIIWRFVCRN